MVDLEHLRNIDFTRPRQRPPVDLLERVANQVPRDVVTMLAEAGSGHPDSKKCPGLEVSSGSLSQGLSAALGMALPGKLDVRSYRVFALIGDGESGEGQIWEAAMAAAHYNAHNLVAALDNNELQIDGPVREVLGRRCPVPLECVGIDDQFGRSGEPEDLFEHHALTADDIAQAARRAVSRRR